MSLPQEHIPERLRDRVRVLGDLLGETMAEQYGQEFLDKIEEIRGYSKQSRLNPGSQTKQLLGVLKNLEDDDLTSVAKAFNQFLNLANIAHDVETASREGQFVSKSANLDVLFEKLLEEGKSQQEIVDAVLKLHCELVLTANPTEITSRTLIQKYDRIAGLLERVDETSSDQQQRAELKRLVAEVWYTDRDRSELPEPQDEAKWGFAVIEHSFWHALPELWRGLDLHLQRHTGQSLPIDFTPMKILSWMGGDRVSNPNVTAEVTREVLRLARWMAADLYHRDIDQLLSHLSMSRCNDNLAEMVGHTSSEPYRVVLRALRERLASTLTWTAADGQPFTDDVIVAKEDLYLPLYACYESLNECGMGIIADGLLKDALIRVACFGINLVDIDVRQSSHTHAQLLDELTQYLELGSYLTWSESERQSFLLTELQNKRPLIPAQWQPTEESLEVLRTFYLLAEVKAAGVANYIISLTRNPSDVLAVILLLRKCGLEQRLQVVPLFETLEDLDNAAWTLERLFHIPWYFQYIEGRQQLMIGYSESAKDAGQMAAAWLQYRAQEELVDRCNKAGVQLTLFHGRGGSMARGGGSAHQAILSQPPGSVNGGIRVTEQGEMIRSKYGSPSLALMNLDLVLSATIEASLLPLIGAKEDWRRMMDQLADTARNEYDRIVQDNVDFADYFDQGTPAEELTRLAFGGGQVQPDDDDSLQMKNSIENLPAIPWNLAWTQKRLMLPAWLGTDKALSEFKKLGKLHLLQEMLDEWPFFNTQINMLERVLAKSDMGISSYYDEALVDQKLRYLGDLFGEKLIQLIHLINELKRQGTLLESDQETNAALEIKHPYTDPLQFLQVELVSRRRNQMQENSTRLDAALLETIVGIAASLRNTG
ncbi:MAG: phosphoenolpyruvate carboxylase [Pseudomonadales bacterium]|nr:phosphoenolpyruvate carboxylase [Pseudomonadales bacterium]MDP7357978.1 phosphoenolpyruvate carboxylase [Pseudomonadales bacterium]HJN51939.1 phosphoenolpyruvate carboxylase [Pseudomonadales bacterium]